MSQGKDCKPDGLGVWCLGGMWTMCSVWRMCHGSDGWMPMGFAWVKERTARRETRRVAACLGVKYIANHSKGRIVHN